MRLWAWALASKASAYDGKRAAALCTAAVCMSGLQRVGAERVKGAVRCYSVTHAGYASVDIHVGAVTLIRGTALCTDAR